MGRLIRLALWSRSSTPRTREIVLEVLKKTYPVPIHTRELFQRIREEYPDEKPQLPSPDLPLVQIRRVTTPSPETGTSTIPFPDHLIRSAKYLREIVMGDMVHRKQVQKVHSMRVPTPEELAQKTSKKKNKKSKNSNASSVTINVKGMVDEWGWVLRTPEEAEKMKQEEKRIKNALEGQKLLDVKQLEKDKRVRFLELWGHLNVRRQRARAEKLEREEKKTIELEKLREEGRKEGQIGVYIIIVGDSIAPEFDVFNFQEPWRPRIAKLNVIAIRSYFSTQYSIE
ncbi:hypothetical protein Clacol_002710 [Clathrus columnatus]|uniref:Uncharacterized protein n=1 Tax=Clathrus columnatus TaxID=1419009 RepID=A0AAV5A1I0_9AGAM|nr:hypothetical protein Clacol_002710 [Clathrus columnatus]